MLWNVFSYIMEAINTPSLDCFIFFIRKIKKYCLFSLRDFMRAYNQKGCVYGGRTDWLNSLQFV